MSNDGNSTANSPVCATSDSRPPCSSDGVSSAIQPVVQISAEVEYEAFRQVAQHTATQLVEALNTLGDQANRLERIEIRTRIVPVLDIVATPRHN